MEKFFIFGAGIIGKSVYEKLRGFEIVGFVDNDPKKREGDYCGKKVYSPNEVSEYIREHEDVTVVIASNYVSQISAQLKEKGINSICGHEELNYIELAEEKNIDEITLKKEIDIVNKEIISIGEAGTKIESVLLAGYNQDDLNFGCRATSEALRKVLSANVRLSEVFYRYELMDLFNNLSLSNTITDYIAKCKIICREDIEYIKSKISKYGAVVINGEGSFIFRKKPRRDMYNFCVLMYLCIEMGIPFYLVNAMISGENDSETDSEKVAEVSLIMNRAVKIYLRDMESVKILSNYADAGKVSYVPDALFYDYKYYSLAGKHNIPEHVFGVAGININVKKDYIVVSGNSLAVTDKNRACECYRQLIVKLRDLMQQRDMGLILLECCPGDRFLKGIADELSIPIVPIETEVKVIGFLLQKAKCFVSGRYHPSIACALGGTPGVYLGSNSHKTLSLQGVLDEANPVMYSAFPNEEECDSIVKDVDRIINTHDRQKLLNVANANCSFMEEMYEKLFWEREK